MLRVAGGFFAVAVAVGEIMLLQTSLSWLLKLFTMGVLVMVAAAIMFAVAKHEEIIFLTVTSIVGCIGMLLVLIAILLAHVAEYWKGSEMIALFLVSAAYCFVCGRLRDDSRPITKPPATGPLQPPPDPNQGMWGDAS